jgi:hypothetical protein
MPPPPDLDRWLDDPDLTVAYHRHSRVSAPELWDAARAVPLSDTGRLGRLVRWRIPGLERDVSFDGLFRHPPFMVLEESETALVSGLVGRIWTLRRDYPQLGAPQDFLAWSHRGTVRVAFAHWTESAPRGSTLSVDVRVQAIGAQGRLGLSAVRPLVRAFANLIASEGIAAAVRRAEHGRS